MIRSRWWSPQGWNKSSFKRDPLHTPPPQKISQRLQPISPREGTSRNLQCRREPSPNHASTLILGTQTEFCSSETNCLLFISHSVLICYCRPNGPDDGSSSHLNGGSRNKEQKLYKISLLLQQLLALHHSYGQHFNHTSYLFC